jgi:hypothetical protein
MARSRASNRSNRTSHTEDRWTRKKHKQLFNDIKEQSSKEIEKPVYFFNGRFDGETDGHGEVWSYKSMI